MKSSYIGQLDKFQSPMGFTIIHKSCNNKFVMMIVHLPLMDMPIMMYVSEHFELEF